MKYFIDANLSPHLLEDVMVDDAAVAFVPLRSEFPSNTKPSVWIKGIKGKDYIVLSLATSIANFRKHRAELEQYNTTVFSLPRSRFEPQKIIAQKAWIGIHFPQIHAYAVSLSLPSGVQVAPNGRCTTLWTVGSEAGL